MNDALRQLAVELHRGIAIDDSFASELAKLSKLARKYELQDDEAPMIAEALINLSRLHRVKEIELRARLAALAAEYGFIASNEDFKQTL